MFFKMGGVLKCFHNFIGRKIYAGLSMVSYRSLKTEKIFFILIFKNKMFPCMKVLLHWLIHHSLSKIADVRDFYCFAGICL